MNLSLLVGEDGNRLLATADAARFLGISGRTLEDWRLTGKGPVFRKLGRMVRYLASDLAAFVDNAARLNTGGATPL